MPSSTTQHGLVDRVQDFVAENKKAVLIGAAVATVAVGGAFYYASSSSAPGSGERRSKKKSSKDKSEKSKKKTVKDADGPLLEEVEAPALEDTLNDEQIAALPVEQRSKIAASFKQKGNTAYQSRKFEEAAVLYTRAIASTPKAEPVFYSNRAACYMNMSPPAYDKVVADCDEALKLDKNYLKAMNRRATALESLERYEEALRDFTAAAILDRFQNKATGDAVERVLKAVTGKRAAEILASRQPRLPSYTFISAYFAAFRPRPHPALPEEPSQGDQTLQLAFGALDAANYIHSFTLVQEAVEQGISSDEAKGEALNLRGTFKFLMGDVEGAKNDLLQSLQFAPGLTQSLVKLASVYMEQSEPEKAAQSFDDAQGMNPDDPDIYYHRGQVLFIMNQFSSAADNYTKSTELDDTFVFSHIQYAVAEYKQGNIGKSMAAFRRTLGAFPQRSEPYNYYGELLLDQQHFGEAIEKFERAFELEKARTDDKIPNVLPLVNKGLTMYQWKQEIAPAEEACHEALAIDPECDAAVATLAQLSLQQGKIDEAVKYFEKQVELARTEPEVTGALTYEYATRSQAAFLQNYPEMAAQLNQMAKAMG
ncbi:mitochondrial outer membrane translocase receptor TOM70 [Cylindrobasidium torrendii FP15055 ss-10]|uniref:Mitochondrial outer membrane translocase receptor TOM70 n=1 Tax=Cylindrobasidium torrendii FP15055 ss-10 TaxID=1314674 RepID=A0A0D7B8X1_9AGAR|nr:mitochondrial outer membrane translocase receptor TOM70 [Cylindrobasidium torrendii FP15055 ss-10]